MRHRTGIKKMLAGPESIYSVQKIAKQYWASMGAPITEDTFWNEVTKCTMKTVCAICLAVEIIQNSYGFMLPGVFWTICDEVRTQPTKSQRIAF